MLAWEEMSKIEEKKQEMILSLFNISNSANSVLYFSIYKKYNAINARKDNALKKDAACYYDYNKAFPPSTPPVFLQNISLCSHSFRYMFFCFLFFWLGFL